MVRVGDQALLETYESAPLEQAFIEEEIELPFDVHYEMLLNLFHKYRATVDGPWKLSNSVLRMLHAQNNLPGGPNNGDMHPIWSKMINELCPTQLIIPLDFKVEEEIDDVDDNKDFIYATGTGVFLGDSVRVLRISNPAIAMLLKLAN